MRLSKSVQTVIRRMMEEGHGIPDYINFVQQVSSWFTSEDDGDQVENFAVIYEITGWSPKLRLPYQKAEVGVYWQQYDDSGYSSRIVEVAIDIQGVFVCTLEEQSFRLTSTDRAADLVTQKGWQFGTVEEYRSARERLDKELADEAEALDFETARQDRMDEIALQHASALDAVWADHEARQAAIRRERQIASQEM